jgi:hypothetical protein
MPRRRVQKKPAGLVIVSEPVIIKQTPEEYGSDPVNRKQWKKEKGFHRDLRAMINRYGYDNEAATPDYILAQYLIDCLKAYTDTIGAYQKHKEDERDRALFMASR